MKRILLFGLLIAVACSNEEPEWRAASSENSISALEGFIAAHPDGEFADSAKDQLQDLQLDEALNANTIEGYLAFLALEPGGGRRGEAQEALNALFDTRAREAPPLEAITYLRDPTMLRVLKDAVGEEIARRFRKDGQWLLVESVSGDTLHSTGLTSDGAPASLRWVCLDETGRIIRTVGGPVFVPPFQFHTYVPQGAVTSSVEYDPYGRPSVQFEPYRGCTDCAERTGASDCVFVW